MIWVAYLCWGAFLVVWLGGYLYNLARGPRSVRSRGELETGAWVARVLIALAVVLLASQRELRVRDLLLNATADPIMSAVGAVVLVAATAFTLWARVSLGTMWSSTPTIKAGHELRTDGPYRVTRHPIYTGMLGMFLGTTLLTGSVIALIAFALFIVYIALKIRTEETLLIETFGDEYRRLQQTVPAVIPFWRRARS